jgi:hypothetical protein
MTSDLPGTIELHQSIPHPLGGGAVIGGSSYLDDRAAWRSVWPSRNDAGEHGIRRHEGDTFEFAGATWRVTKVFEPSLGGRSRVTTLSKVE